MTDAYRIIFAQPGGPDVLTREAIEPPAPGAGEIRVCNEAVGVNFIDIYHRRGLYPLPLPSGLGSEGAGVVEAVGDGVAAIRPGMRVAYMVSRPVAYATHVALPAAQAFPLPDAIGADVAAALLLKGLTAWMLVERIAHAGPGTRVLVHAAAGGVGSIAVQWAKALGATVIAHAGTAEKASRAATMGADHALCCPMAELAAQVRSVTDGAGADAVLDGVGAESWAASLGAVARRGVIVSYGNASGPVPPVAPLDLLKAGSAFLTRPTVFDYVAEEHDRIAAADRLFALVADGTIDVAIGQRFALGQAADAHRALEARQTTGSTILIP